MTPKPQPPLDLWEQLDRACDMVQPVRTSDTFTIRELAARRNISYVQARNLVYKMEASGLVERVGGTPVLFRMKREEERR